MAHTELLVQVKPCGHDDLDPLLADWKWAYDRLSRGEFERFEGQFVAVLEGEVAGVGIDQEELRDQVSQQRAVIGERVVIIYVDAGEFLT
jgi:hypothetical protein